MTSSSLSCRNLNVETKHMRLRCWNVHCYAT